MEFKKAPKTLIGKNTPCVYNKIQIEKSGVKDGKVIYQKSAKAKKQCNISPVQAELLNDQMYNTLCYYEYVDCVVKTEDKTK